MQVQAALLDGRLKVKHLSLIGGVSSRSDHLPRYTQALVSLIKDPNIRLEELGIVIQKSSSHRFLHPTPDKQTNDALDNAIKTNHSLKSIQVDCDSSREGLTRGIAFINVLKENRSIRSFEFRPSFYYRAGGSPNDS